MNILVACEESQTVTMAFKNLQHNVFSCDILPTTGPRTDLHIQGDVLKIIKYKWDMIIAFPPCTDLSNAQNIHIMNKKIEQGKPQKALEFIKKIYNSAPRVAIENPLSSYLNKNWKRPDQIIEPFYFGHNYRKRTCLWLKNLPFLISTCFCEPKSLWVNVGKKNQKLPGLHNDAKNRSKFHYGIAEAMANQWNF